MSITTILATYPPIALDPAKLIAEVFAALPEAKRKTIKPESLRSLTIDARVQEWMDSHSVEIPDTNGQFRLF